MAPKLGGDPVDENFLHMNALYQEALSIVPSERGEIMREISHLHADNVWTIATGFWQRPFIKSNRLGNAPDVISRNGQIQIASWQHATLFEKYPPGEAP